MKHKLPLLLLTLSMVLGGCQTTTSSPKIPYAPHAERKIEANVLCQSFNLGDNLQAQLDSTSLQLNLPVARFNNSAQGRAVIIRRAAWPTGGR